MQPDAAPTSYPAPDFTVGTTPCLTQWRSTDGDVLYVDTQIVTCYARPLLVLRVQRGQRVQLCNGRVWASAEPPEISTTFAKNGELVEHVERKRFVVLEVDLGEGQTTFPLGGLSLRVF